MDRVQKMCKTINLRKLKLPLNCLFFQSISQLSILVQVSHVETVETVHPRAITTHAHVQMDLRVKIVNKVGGFKQFHCLQGIWHFVLLYCKTYKWFHLCIRIRQNFAIIEFVCLSRVQSVHSLLFSLKIIQALAKQKPWGTEPTRTQKGGVSGL